MGEAAKEQSIISDQHMESLQVPLSIDLTKVPLAFPEIHMISLVSVDPAPHLSVQSSSDSDSVPLLTQVTSLASK